MATRSARHGVRALGGLIGALVLVLLAMPGSDAQATTVVVNELQPRNSTTITDGDGDNEDWIELRNTTGDAIDLTGWRIEDSGAQWPFPEGTIIPANGFVLVWASDKGDPLDAGYPGPAGELHANFQLNGTADSVTLVNASSAIVDTISYDLAFGQDESYGRNDAGTFVLFAAGGATPLAPNGAVPTPTPTAAPAPPSIVINEAMQSNATVIADGDGEFEDWFELFNPTCQTVDMTGWSVRDSSESWQLPAGTTMAPGAVLFLWASNKGDPDNVAEFPGPAGELHTSFQLAAAGEDVYLLDDLGRLVATVALPAALEDDSYGLNAGGIYTTFVGAAVSPGATNPGQAVPICAPTATPTPTSTPAPTPTPGGPTLTPTPAPTPTAIATPTATPTPTPEPGVCASLVRINELQTGNDQTIADGDGDFSDWIELFNTTAAPVDLSGWRITDSGNTFVIPPGTSLDANGFLLVWASDKGDPSEPGFPGPAGEVHANFRLSGSGETVSLFDTTTCLVDRVSAPALIDEQSFGVTTDGSLGVFNIGYTTPLAPNGKQSMPPQVACYGPDSPVRMNRIVARNGGLLLDADGDESDFIELLNTGFGPVNLSAWQLRDESDRSIIPAGTVIAGGDTLILWASGKGFVLDADYPGPAGEIHLTFRLAGEGEQLTLSEPSECIVEQFVYPELLSNHAYGYDEQGQRAILVPGGSDSECAAAGSLQIVAVSPRNDAGRADEDGEFGDWLELRNTTGGELDLGGWVISDEGSTWVVPDGVVAAADAVVVVWADDKNRGGAGAALHTNFRLGGDGETITVGSSLGCPVDIVTYPALDDDQVYRRAADAIFGIEGAAAAAAVAETPDPAPSDVSVFGTCIAINEIMAKNDSTLEDDAGEFGDWIELANLGNEPIDLSGYQISDSEDSWTIPDGVEIDTGAFLILWADGVDRGAAGDELHTNFKLSSEGEPLTLIDRSGAVVASLSSYPELDDDESFGVDKSGNYVFIAAGDATPGEGPIRDGCDFELAAGAGDAAATPGDESDEADDADAVASAEDLARTGSDTRGQWLLAQLLLLTGLTLVAMAKIAHRRSRI